MRDFYESRIKAEQQNLENLLRQSSSVGWEIEQATLKISALPYCAWGFSFNSVRIRTIQGSVVNPETVLALIAESFVLKNQLDDNL